MTESKIRDSVTKVFAFLDVCYYMFFPAMLEMKYAARHSSHWDIRVFTGKGGYEKRDLEVEAFSLPMGFRYVKQCTRQCIANKEHRHVLHNPSWAVENKIDGEVICGSSHKPVKP